MYGLLAESHIRNYNIRIYQVAREGGYIMTPPVISVFHTIMRQAGYLLRQFKCI